MLSHFDKIGVILNKIDVAFIDFGIRAQKLPICKRNIFTTKSLFWKFELMKIFYEIFKGNKNIRFNDINTECINYLKKYKLADEDLIKFFFKFHSQFSCAYVKYINKKLKMMTSENFIDCFDEIVSDFLELINITLIELNNIEINCMVLKDTEIKKYRHEDCRKCEKESSNIIMLYIMPEYLLFKNVFDNLIESFKMIKKKSQVLLIINYKNICDRMIDYNWEKTGAYNRYKTVKQYVHDIYFYNYNKCVNFGKYYNEIKDKLIKNKIELMNLINNWKKDSNLIIDDINGCCSEHINKLKTLDKSLKEKNK